MGKNLNLEETIKRFNGIINTRCPICNELLNTCDSEIFKTSDIGFHTECIKGKTEDEIEDIVDDVLDDVYGTKVETIMEGERDTVLNRYDYGDYIGYVVEYWNDDRTAFGFGTEYDTFEEAYKKFKSMQHED